MTNAICLGWYGHDNCGDEAYKLAFPKLFPQHDLTFTDNLKATDPQGVHAVILGGGNVLEPTFVKGLADLKKKDIALYAMSVNITSEEQAERSKIFDKLIVRDTVSLYFGGGRATYLPDFTFILQGDQQRGRTILERRFREGRFEMYNQIVLVVLNSYLLVRPNMLAKDKNTFEKVTDDLAELIDGTNASFVFVPFGMGIPQDDRITNGMLASKCKFWKKNLMIWDNLSVQDTLDIFTVADAAITSRLHASIFSCIGGTPFIDLTHHDKNRVFVHSVMRPHWSIDYWHFNQGNAQILLQSFLNDKEKTEQQDLLHIAARNRLMLQTAVQHIEI
jgi:polysaccharide pyruvyl transferase WcaK-like protein